LQQSKEAPDLADKVEEAKLKLEEGAGARRSVDCGRAETSCAVFGHCHSARKDKPAP